MAWIQVDIPEELDKFIGIEKIKRNNITKSETIVELLKEKGGIKDGGKKKR